MSLCERFPSLDPFQINNYPALDFFKLIRDINEHDERTTKDKNSYAGNSVQANGDKKTFRIKATD